MTRLILSVAMFLSFSTAAFAQNASKDKEPNSSPTKYPKVQRIDIEAENVEGGRALPLGELISGSRKGKHSSLIEIRNDFVPEMLKSVNDF